MLFFFGGLIKTGNLIVLPLIIAVSLCDGKNRKESHIKYINSIHSIYEKFKMYKKKA